MTRPSFLLWLSIGASVALLIVWEASRLSTARYDMRTALDRLSGTTIDVRELLTLRAKSDSVAIGRRPEQDMLARVHDALADAGLPSSAFVGQNQESDAAAGSDIQVGNQSYRKQVVRLSFKSLMPKQLGSLLSSWRQLQPIWIPTRIELSHVAEGGGNAYDVTLFVTAVYVDDSGRPVNHQSGGDE